jgi:hypothetical protein
VIPRRRRRRLTLPATAPGQHAGPVPERGLSGGATELGRLLEQHDLVAQPADEQGRRQAAPTTADDDDVRLDIELGFAER